MNEWGQTMMDKCLKYYSHHHFVFEFKFKDVSSSASRNLHSFNMPLYSNKGSPLKNFFFENTPFPLMQRKK